MGRGNSNNKLQAQPVLGPVRDPTTWYYFTSHDTDPVSWQISPVYLTRVASPTDIFHHTVLPETLQPSIIDFLLATWRQQKQAVNTTCSLSPFNVLKADDDEYRPNIHSPFSFVFVYQLLTVCCLELGLSGLSVKTMLMRVERLKL